MLYAFSMVVFLIWTP